MPRGFFSEASLITNSPPTTGVPKCGACKLYKTCLSPKMPYSGKGKKGILIVGEAPGKNEDEQGIQFCGSSGNRLEETLAEFGINMRRDCWLTNSIICRPQGNETPDDKKLRYCRPNLTKTLEKLKPKVIITFGARAIKSLLMGLWKEDVGEMTRWAGWQIPCQSLNSWICPTWHPAYLGYQGDPALDLWWKRHLEAAVAHQERPWPLGPPDYESQIEIVYDATEAARIIRKMALLGDHPAAFDYETNMLKPDGPDARIVSCSISWEGKRTIAYPWHGKAIDATKEFLASPAPKRASNMKFEDRWTRKEFGFKPRNWEWDTMQAAHVLDNRHGITSIKFQAFVRLGVPIYDTAIKPYLESPEANIPNRITEIPLDKLLLYNGLDSLLEWIVSEKQRQELGYE